jgi:hypothetical protein
MKFRMAMARDVGRRRHEHEVLRSKKNHFFIEPGVSIKTVVGMTAIAFLALSASAQSATTSAPESLSGWGLHCWCLTARHTPQRIVRSDNNGSVLQLAVGGITRAELDRSLPGVSESQLALLQTYGLLSYDGVRYTTAFLVFGPERINPIRA